MEDFFVHPNRVTLISKTFSKLSKLPLHHQIVKNLVIQDLCHQTKQKLIMKYFHGKNFEKIFQDDKFGWKSYYKNSKLFFAKGGLWFFLLLERRRITKNNQEFETFSFFLTQIG